MQQCLTFSWGKICKIIFRVQIWAKGVKIGPKTRCFCHFHKFGFLVFLEIAYNDSLQQCITSSRDKIHKKFFGAQIWAKGARTSSRAETSEKKNCGPNWDRSDLFYSNVIECPLKLACSDWDNLCNYLRDVLWQDIFKLTVSATVAEFC